MASSSLSDKAKGKQRATEPLRIQDQEVPLPKTLIIRFSEGIPDLTLQVEERDAVRDIKHQVCYIVPSVYMRILTRPDSRLQAATEGQQTTLDTFWQDTLRRHTFALMARQSRGSAASCDFRSGGRIACLAA